MRPIFLTLMVLALVACIDDPQDIQVNPVQHPFYTLHGRVYLSTDSSYIPFPIVRVTMFELYQGDWLPMKHTTGDSLGFYQIDSLYRGAYVLEVSGTGAVRYTANIGMIQYADKEVDVYMLPPPDRTLRGHVRFSTDSSAIAYPTISLEALELDEGMMEEAREVTGAVTGAYVIDSLYRGLYRLDAEAAGAQPFSHDLGIMNSQIREFDVFMNPLPSR